MRRSLTALAAAFAVLLPVVPVGADTETTNSVLRPTCQNQNTVDNLCEAFAFIDIIITPGAKVPGAQTAVVVPQFLYRAGIRNPFNGSTQSATEDPLGFISTTLAPHPTETAPRTYWVRHIDNATNQTVTVAQCTTNREAPVCGTAASRINYVIPAGGTVVLIDPASQIPPSESSFPPGEPEDQRTDPQGVHAYRNQSFFLTLKEFPNARGRIDSVYFNCAFGGINTCDPSVG